LWAFKPIFIPAPVFLANQFFKHQPKLVTMKTIFGRVLSLLPLLLLAQAAIAGTGRINPDGTMDFSVNFRYPPGPADLTRVRNALIDANNIICDATDGQFRFGTIRFTAGAAREDEADIWIYAEGGRSGVSFFTNGASFGTLGSHIVLYQGGITGGTIAHELGHLAFGLGDEYNEQCRWGGPCGLGPCFDAGGDHLMMQSGDQSELCVAANHDLLMGNAACPPGELCAGRGPCTAGDCNIRWNSATNRFETTQQELIHPGLSSWETLEQNYPAQTTPPVGLPNAARPAGCGTPAFIEEVTGTDQIMLFIDRSGSMSARINGGDPDSETRMDFAKAAARAFVNLRAGTGAKIGLVSFDDVATLERNIIDLSAADAPTLQTTIDGLSPRGMTAIGDALLAAVFPFQAAAAGGNRTAFLLSDGQNTAGSDPRTAAQSLENQGVRIFTVPVGDAADRTLLSDISAASRAAMLDAPVGDELPPIFLELAARSRGESLVLSRTPVAVSGRRQTQDNIELLRAQGQRMQDTATINFDVENFSPRLNLMISTRHPNVSSWMPSFVLRGPGGERITQADTKNLVVDPFYVLVRLDNPSAGRWALTVASGNGLPQFSYVAAHTEGPRPDFFVDAVPSILQNTSKPVDISARAVYGADLDEGVNYQLRVKRPDGSIVPITFEVDPHTRAVSAQFNQFNYRGVYEVLAECEVTGAAKLMPGESIFPGPDVVNFNVTPFKRSNNSYFVLRSGGLPPCNTPDCDNDGILNDQENPNDLDFDGYPGPRDSDQDGDDVPDQDEPNRDDDNDGIPNPQDPDSDNDNIPDGRDPDHNPGLESAVGKRRLWYSVHLGSAHPLGKLDSLADASIHATFDLTYMLKRNINLKALFSIHQFAAESSTGIAHPRWWSASLNGQVLLPRPLNMKPYVQGGFGLYRSKNNTTTGGFNLGIGGQTQVNSQLHLTAGLDLHQSAFKGGSRFLALHFGMLFR
jgi:hypothetical protein